jgi:hypothetical protein
MTNSFSRFLSHAGIIFGLSLGAVLAAADNETQYSYLSGKGPKDAVPWEFSVTGGRRAGEKTTIPVPSNWELQGFGGYNYGQEPVPKADEHGLYRRHFAIPAAWKGRRIRIVFEGVMTDAFVKVNGREAGPVHQGGFYRFRYDITPLVKLGADNLLEVDVAKVSANASVEGAERSGDFWVFGGIYRPVYLEAVPAQSIEQAAIDARADGALSVDVTLGSVREADHVEGQVLAADGQAVGAPFSVVIPNGGTGRVRLSTRIDSPHRWTAETPNLYALRLNLLQGAAVLHTISERFGFRTFEVRAGQGLFLNGQRNLLKGVGRHSFRPETGRALTREDCYDDARLIKEMNMNAVRMTHYPPDPAFLEACDELGLYVLDELTGWHHAYDTQVGRQLVRDMVDRDVNHPSILFWDNGNEGGWNRDLDGEYGLYDPQHRTVLHPWELFDGVDTKHYPTYDDLETRLRGPNLVMPTEMIHGLYDGGAGSGLEDYWNLISHSPHGAGGFIWVFADDGIVRTDQGGRVDVFSTYAPDGILGPHHEKEGSFYTVRDLYSPVQIDAPVLDEHFDGTLAVHNRYYFTSLAQCRFVWRLLRYRDPAAKETAPVILAEGPVTAPAVAPQASGRLALGLPANWREADALSLAVAGPDGHELWNSVWPTPALARHLAPDDSRVSSPSRVELTNPAEVDLRAGAFVARFDRLSGMLREVRQREKVFPFANGPRLVFARPSRPDDVQWLALDAGAPGSWTSSSAAGLLLGRLAAPHLANTIEVTMDYPHSVSWQGFRLEISPDGQHWKTLYDATRRTIDGKLYEFPPQLVAAVRFSNFRRSDSHAVAIQAWRIGYEAARFPADVSNSRTVTTGTTGGAAWLESTAAEGLTQVRWTLEADGALRLDYRYALNGTYSYHGITFDYPEDEVRGMRWLGQGPYRVWQNRLRGTWLGVHEILSHDVQPGETWDYPEFQGCFAGLRWVRFDTASGPLTVTSAQPEAYFRIGTPRISHINTTVAFPAGDISFLQAIPPMGSKFIGPEKTGPSSQWAKASGDYAGTLTFRFGP